jgi:hypothetical protein
MTSAARPQSAAQRIAAAALTVDRPAARTARLPTVPAHVATMLGLAVAGYGVALAMVTGLQSASDAAVLSNRQPLTVTLDQLEAGHDRLGRAVDDVTGRYDAAAGAFQDVADGFPAIEDRLAALAASAKALDGASRALPASVALPPVVRSVRTATGGTTGHATSGGSAP